jgi:hypothetical protein
MALPPLSSIRLATGYYIPGEGGEGGNGERGLYFVYTFGNWWKTGEGFERKMLWKEWETERKRENYQGKERERGRGKTKDEGKRMKKSDQGKENGKIWNSGMAKRQARRRKRKRKEWEKEENDWKNKV